LDGVPLSGVGADLVAGTVSSRPTLPLPDERVLTYNERDLTDLNRFSAVLGAISGRRLTYAALAASS
jgi:hypothetical protein